MRTTLALLALVVSGLAFSACDSATNPPGSPTTGIDTTGGLGQSDTGISWSIAGLVGSGRGGGTYTLKGKLKPLESGDTSLRYPRLGIVFGNVESEVLLDVAVNIHKFSIGTFPVDSGLPVTMTSSPFASAIVSSQLFTDYCNYRAHSGSVVLSRIEPTSEAVNSLQKVWGSMRLDLKSQSFTAGPQCPDRSLTATFKGISVFNDPF